MDILSMIMIVGGLCLFETISSIDNAIINAQVLSTMGEKARRWFLIWGLFFAVFVIRGLLPWVIVWASTPSLGPMGALTATFSNDPKVIEAIETAAPALLMGGGVFLLFLFLLAVPGKEELRDMRRTLFYEKRCLVLCNRINNTICNCLVQPENKLSCRFQRSTWLNSLFHYSRLQGECGKK